MSETGSAPEGRPSQKIYIMRGLPGCGKTTTARMMQEAHPHTIMRVSRDDLRAMGFSPTTPWDTRKKMEQPWLAVRNKIIRESITAGFSIIVDDTNITSWHLQELQILAGRLTRDKGLHVLTETIDLRDVPLESCLAQNLMRPQAEQVPELEIRKMHAKMLEELQFEMKDTIQQYRQEMSKA